MYFWFCGRRHVCPGAYPRGCKWIYTPELPCIVPQGDIFLTDIIGYDRLKLYLKIYTPPKWNPGYATVAHNWQGKGNANKAYIQSNSPQGSTDLILPLTYPWRMLKLNHQGAELGTKSWCPRLPYFGRWTPSFSSATCSEEEAFGISGQGFVWAARRSSHPYQWWESTDRHSKHWREPNHECHPLASWSFTRLHPFMPALWRRHRHHKFDIIFTQITTEMFQHIKLRN